MTARRADEAAGVLVRVAGAVDEVVDEGEVMWGSTMCIAVNLSLVKVGIGIEDLVSMSAVLSAVAIHFVTSSQSCCHSRTLKKRRST